ncbi:MAG TPA: DinB family protein [Bryobacteraceae bacterium]|nr:DinB family protein [Bryobacteraceae bacterium]
MIEQEFLKFSADKLTQLSGRIQDCVGRLSHEQVWTRGHESENSVGNLVLHLCGNVGQWIGSGVGGQQDTRQRDAEFAARGDVQPAELSERLNKAVSAAAAIIRDLPPARLMESTTVQKYDVTVLEAIYHVVEHFSQHTGQIIFATKLLTGDDLGYYKHLNQPKHFETTP